MGEGESRAYFQYGVLFKITVPIFLDAIIFYFKVIEIFDFQQKYPAEGRNHRLF